MVECASLPRGCLCYHLDLFAELVHLKRIVFFLGCVPAERGFLFLLLIYRLELAALDLKLKLISEGGNDAVCALKLEGVDELSLGAVTRSDQRILTSCRSAWSCR